MWGFPKIRGTILGVPRIGMILYYGLYWGPAFQGHRWDVGTVQRRPGKRRRQRHQVAVEGHKGAWKPDYYGAAAGPGRTTTIAMTMTITVTATLTIPITSAVLITLTAPITVTITVTVVLLSLAWRQSGRQGRADVDCAPEDLIDLKRESGYSHYALENVESSDKKLQTKTVITLTDT